MARAGRAGDLLDRIRAEIDDRLSELRPHVEEHEKLLAAADSLALGVGGTSARKPAPLSKPAVRRVPRGRSASSKLAAAPASARRARASGAKKRVAAQKGPVGATQQAIAAALEHGSHTLAELVLVTAEPAAAIRAGLAPLQKAGLISRVSRDGKAAYTLLSAASVASAAPRNGTSAK